MDFKNKLNLGGTTLSKTINVFGLLLVAVSFLFAENGENSSPFNKYMSPEGGINPMSGTVALSKSLASISAGEISIDFQLKYSGNVFKEVETRNDQSSVGLVGLGWSFGRSRIVSDNRGTSFLDDDQYYLMMASGERHKIFKKDPSNPDDTTWWIEGNPFMKIEQIVDSTDLKGNGKWIKYVKGWKLKDTKGISHIYGDVDDEPSKILTKPTRNATEYDLFWPLKKDKSFGYGLVGKAIDGEPYLYPSVWNIRKEIDAEGYYVQYSYEQINEELSGKFDKVGKWNSKKKYTKESYLVEVVSSLEDTIRFEYRKKGEGDFFGEFYDYDGLLNEQLGDTDSDMSIEKVNRKYLSKISVHRRGSIIGSVELCYSPLNPIGKDGKIKKNFVKRLLSAVRFFNKLGEETDYEYYQYYDGTESADSSGNAYPPGALYSVKGKDCGWVEYAYRNETLGSGHVETVAVSKIFGKGRLEDGSPYLVGKRSKNTVVVFHRINGSWKEVQTISTNDVDDVQFGDQGWFLIKDKLSSSRIGAYVYQWDGRIWQKKYSDDVNNPEHAFFENPLKESTAMNVFAGPDYVVETLIGGSYFSSSAKVRVIWSKWGKTFEVGNGFDDAQITKDGVYIIPQKNHILVQVFQNKFFGNGVQIFVYTFDNDGGVQQTYEEDELDNSNSYFLTNDYFIAVEEPSAYVGGDSRFRARVWTGTEWSQEYKEFFANDGAYTAMDLQAHGADYYAIRHHAKRYMTNFYWNGEVWDIPEGLKRVQILDDPWFSSAWAWAGFSGSDFYVVGQSRLSCGWLSGCDVKKYVYLHLYYLKDKKWNHWYIGSKGEKTKEKEVITGRDWFVEKNEVRYAWIWDGNEWKEESLNWLGDLDDAVSLGDDAFAVPSGNQTKIVYKVGNSFKLPFNAYRVYKKTIFEPVVDKKIEYSYVFDAVASANIAYDEANNTPLFTKMTVFMPNGRGSMVSELCSGEYNGEYNVGLGATCVETQYGAENSGGYGVSALLSKKTYHYYRYRGTGWPNNVYQDRIDKEVSFNGTTKSVNTYEYSDKNGLLVSTKKRNGTKTTEEVYKYVIDFASDIDEYAKKLGDSNRIDAIAGGYSCINNCSNGTIVSAFANGWDWATTDKDFRSVSSWKMTPKSKMTRTSVEKGIKKIVKNGAMLTYSNWTRSSYNSKYLNGELIETTEGPNNIKVTSFKNPVTHRLYGTAGNCGYDEGLMLSGEYCGQINDVTWSGCVLSEKQDGINGYAVDGNTGASFGRFSNKVLKLSKNRTLSASIGKPVIKKYRVYAWLQTLDNDSVKVKVTLGSSSKEKNVLTNKSWQRIEFEFAAPQTTNAMTFSMSTTAPSGIRLQDIRVLPYDATSSALFWNETWKKVQTTVDNRGVGSYSVYDNLGREIKHYSETDDGTVYMSSRNTFVDGNCVISSAGHDKLKSVKVNGKVYDNPSKKKTFSLDAVDLDVEFKLVNETDEIQYALVKGKESDVDDDSLNWIVDCCGGLKPVKIDFSEESEWTLLVDVAPYTDSKPHGDYVFQFNAKDKDWVVYGQLCGFADGKAPRFMNPHDSTKIAYIDKDSLTVYRSVFSQSKWSNSTSAIIDEYVDEYDFAVGSKDGAVTYYVSLLPRENNLEKDDFRFSYPKTFGDENGSFVYRSTIDTAFRAENLKIAVKNNSPAILFRKDVEEIQKTLTLLDGNNPGVTHQETVPKPIEDGKLYSKRWSASSNDWVKLGSIPVFSRDTFSVTISGTDTTVKIVHGNITSYLDGVVCDYNNRNADMILGPNGKYYVAYIGNVKNFEQMKIINDGNGSISGKSGPAYVVIKRLYDASETSLNKSIWAGPSQYSGHPRYEGDILSWDGTNLHAIADVQSVKLASEGDSLFLAIVYRTHPDVFEGDSSSSSISLSERKLVDEGEMALTVFKGTFEDDVSADGVVYSRYLRWTPLEDASITVAKDGNTLKEERMRVAYMTSDDVFDLKVRNGSPYIMFRNADNDDRITVIKYNGSRWLSIGNPAFAYPVQSERSIDFAANSSGKPYVVFKQGFERGFEKRNNRLVAMHYNADGALDLTISALDLGSSSRNSECSFRQYILHHSVNVGTANTITVKPTLNTPSNVDHVDIYVNDKFVLSRTATSSTASTINLSKEWNLIELRVVGTDGSDLSYFVNVHRKPNPDPGIIVSTKSNVIEGVKTDSNLVEIDVTPVVPPKDICVENPSKCDTTKMKVNVKGGWDILPYNSSSSGGPVIPNGSDIPFVGDTLVEMIAVNSDSDTVLIKIKVKRDTINEFKRSSSSHGNSSSSSSVYENDDGFYQSGLSSSSCDNCGTSSGGSSSGSGLSGGSSGNSGSSGGNSGSGSSSSCDNCQNSSGSGSSGGLGSSGGGSGGSSSSSCGNCHSSSSSHSSSSATFLDSLSNNIPSQARNFAKARYQARGNMRISNQVSVTGTLFAGSRVEIGVETNALHDIVSGGDIMLANRARVGRLRLVGSLQVQQGAVHGQVTRVSSMTNPSMPLISFSTGNSDIMAENNRTINVTAGKYRNLTARDRAKIRFGKGDYYFNSFWVDPNVVLEFAQGTRIWVANNFNIGNFSRVTHSGKVGDLFIYIGASGYVSIGNNVQMKAVVYAPRASVQIYDHTTFEGAVWSANFNVEPSSVLK